MNQQIESLLQQRAHLGFITETPESVARPAEILQIPEVKALTLKDFGLVPLTATAISTYNIARAEIVLSEYGIPMKSPRQTREEREARLSAMAQGKSADSVTSAEELFIEDTSSSRGNQGMTMTEGHVYGLPNSVIFWSMGGRFLDNFPDPTILGTAHPSFDLQRKRYKPDIEELQRRGYGAEGIQRLAMLGLMTDVITNANGLPRLRVDLDKCELLVRFNSQDKLKVKTGGNAIGFLYSLSGIKGLTSDGYSTELETLDGFPPATEAAHVVAAKITKMLLDKDLVDRPAITAGALQAAAVFEKA